MTCMLSLRKGAQYFLALTLLMLPVTLTAQTQNNSANNASKSVNPCDAIRNAPTETRTFYLTNATAQNDSNEIEVAVRNMLCPSVKAYIDWSEAAIVVEAPPEQLALAAKIIHSLDRARNTYRVTYTITERDAAKTIDTEHLSMVVTDGQPTNVREGDKVPVATGSYNSGKASSETQFTYLDVGMNIESKLTAHEGGAVLKTKVEQSSLGQPATIADVQEPVIRQTVFQGSATLLFDKPVMLGSIDVPDSTLHFDIAVVLQEIK